MSEYIVTVNSTVDVPKEWLKERDVPFIPLKYTIDGETYKDMLGLDSKEFFQKLRDGKMAVTTVNIMAVAVTEMISAMGSAR